MIGRIKHFFYYCLLLFSLLAPKSTLAAQCNEGSPLLFWVSTSDAIAIIETVAANQPLIVFKQQRHSFKANFSFLEIIKPNILGPTDSTQRQVIYFPKGEPQSLFTSRKYLAFLQYVKPNVWRVRKCGYLAFMPGNQLRDACVAISDLFGEKPYERERRCLLAYPPTAPVNDVGQEIQKIVLNNKPFVGSGRIVERFKYRSGNSLQQIVFEPDAQTRREQFDSRPQAKPIVLKGYVSSEKYQPREIEQLSRMGRKISFKGRWQKGSLILDELE